MSSHWVRHISGQGEKWEVQEELPLVWKSYDRGIPLALPKSEYILCDPPGQWVDVSAECVFSEEGALVHYGKTELEFGIFPTAKGYRLRKVQVWNGDGATQSMWAFIVEKRVQP